ncbi:Spindle Assembly Abnormal Protein 6 [Manis pentadactyla]|nr:Spindle Assembly Abnormal Protein 6 [Manis pentadactyla]
MGRVGLSIRDWENRKALEISEVAEMVLESDQVACNRVRMMIWGGRRRNSKDYVFFEDLLGPSLGEQEPNHQTSQKEAREKGGMD